MAEVERAEHLRYAYAKADIILRFYRKTDAWDPDVFLAGIAANLAKYTKDIIDEVADPADGIASKRPFPPQPSEVRDACEAIAKPRREAVAREQAIAAQLADRKQLEDQQAERRRSLQERKLLTWEQARVLLGDKPVRSSVDPTEVNVDAVRERLGITQEQWDALPNAPQRKDYWQGIRDPSSS